MELSLALNFYGQLQGRVLHSELQLIHFLFLEFLAVIWVLVISIFLMVY